MSVLVSTSWITLGQECFHHCITVDVEITTSDNNTAGETFTLMCALSGMPESEDVTHIWLRNDTVINTTSDETITESMISPSISQLTFNPLQISHEGVFSCQVMTEGITDKESFNITVNGNHYTK